MLCYRKIVVWWENQRRAGATFSSASSPYFLFPPAPHISFISASSPYFLFSPTPHIFYFRQLPIFFFISASSLYFLFPPTPHIFYFRQLTVVRLKKCSRPADPFNWQRLGTVFITFLTIRKLSPSCYHLLEIFNFAASKSFLGTTLLYYYCYCYHCDGRK